MSVMIHLSCPFYVEEIWTWLKNKTDSVSKYAYDIYFEVSDVYTESSLW